MPEPGYTHTEHCHSAFYPPPSPPPPTTPPQQSPPPPPLPRYKGQSRLCVKLQSLAKTSTEQQSPKQSLGVWHWRQSLVTDYQDFLGGKLEQTKDHSAFCTFCPGSELGGCLGRNRMVLPSLFFCPTISIVLPPNYLSIRTSMILHYGTRIETSSVNTPTCGLIVFEVFGDNAVSWD